MPRRRTRIPLNVLLNNRSVGRLTKTSGGAIEFIYEESWLSWEYALPVSLTLPLREDSYSGSAVSAVFENLLPDSDALRRKVAERVGAHGIDAYSLLATIGHDCVGALQFLPDELMSEVGANPNQIVGEVVSDADIANLLRNLGKAPLGLEPDDGFRISVAGAQEKTALLWHDGKWLKPVGMTPTSHILKPQIGQLPNGINLSNSVENEFYCLKLLGAFGLKVNATQIRKFEDRTTLVIERFDRRWTADGRLLRIPQEDLCQALGIPPTLKYQNQGGPGIVAILNLLRGADDPEFDRLAFFKAQLLFWLIGATDGHAKNFSIFLNSGGRYRMTPLYDVLTAQPSLDAGQIRLNQMKQAMSVGTTNHYRVDTITRRHFFETGRAAGLAVKTMDAAINALVDQIDGALDAVERSLPDDFPDFIHASVAKAMTARAVVLSGTHPG